MPGEKLLDIITTADRMRNPPGALSGAALPQQTLVSARLSLRGPSREREMSRAPHGRGQMDAVAAKATPHYL